MIRKAFTLLAVFLLLLISDALRAQSIDPTLAAMIVLYTEKAESTLQSQEEAMLLESTGHVWIKEEVDATADIQKEFNDYLDTFHGIIAYAAQIYGFYHETEKMIKNLNNLKDQIARSPANAVAVALSANRNKVYRQVILQSVEIGHPDGMPVRCEDDREGTHRGLLRRASEAQGDEQDPPAARPGGEVHLPHGRLERDIRQPAGQG